jgi:gamma-glutamylcyclotransferase (GGCT)/AIG2-like uncharacterized protein YtfP
VNENFNRQFILFDFKHLDDPAFLDFIGAAEFRTFLILLRYVWRGEHHRLGLDEMYKHEHKLVVAIGREFIAKKLRLQDETRVSKHLKKLEDLKLIERTRTGRETIFVVGEWVDISEEHDGSAKKEWFYYERVFGEQKSQDSSNETRKGSDEESPTSDVAQNATSDMQKTPHQRRPETPHQMWRGEPRSNKQTEIYNLNNVNVNAHKEKGEIAAVDKTDLRKLPDIDQPKEKTKYLAEEIAVELNDNHSQAYFYLVAAKVPEDVIRHALAEIKQGGARYPARVFTSRMKTYVADTLSKRALQSIYEGRYNAIGKMPFL